MPVLRPRERLAPPRDLGKLLEDLAGRDGGGPAGVLHAAEFAGERDGEVEFVHAPCEGVEVREVLVELGDEGRCIHG